MKNIAFIFFARIALCIFSGCEHETEYVQFSRFKYPGPGGYRNEHLVKMDAYMDSMAMAGKESFILIQQEKNFDKITYDSINAKWNFYFRKYQQEDSLWMAMKDMDTLVFNEKSEWIEWR